MTRPLNHPVSGLTAEAAARVDAAIDSMAYWQKPAVKTKAQPAAVKSPAEAAIEQMYGYFG